MKAAFWNCMLLTLLTAASCLCSCSGEPVAPLPPRQKPSAASIPNLKLRVDKLLATRDNVDIRADVDDVFALADLLLASGRESEATHYLSAGVRSKPWALNYQMRYAEILGEAGKTEEAREKANLVLAHTEHGDLYSQARQLLGEAPESAIPGVQPVDDPRPTLVLVPVGDADRCVLEDLARELRNVLPMSVLLQAAKLRLPPHARDPRRKCIATMRVEILNRMKRDSDLASFLRKRGCDESRLQDDGEAVLEAGRRLAFHSGGESTLAEFDAFLNVLDIAPKQWDMGELLDRLGDAVKPLARPRVYYLGVTRLDGFSGDNNFLFGLAMTGGDHAIISYARFAADFGNDTPNRKRLVERTLKQALSSIGFMLDVKRCSDPRCARAYPNSLMEHDAKTRKLCKHCRMGFEQALGAPLPNQK